MPVSLHKHSTSGRANRKSFEARERRIQIGIFLEVFSLSVIKALSLFRVRDDNGTDRASLNKCGSDAHNRDEENTASVIVILVDRPKDQTRNLEDVKRMKSLHSLA